MPARRIDKIRNLVRKGDLDVYVSYVRFGNCRHECSMRCATAEKTTSAQRLLVGFLQ